MRTIYLLPIMTIISFCGMNKGFNFKEKDIDQFQYSFHDSSVPPPYHRSYTITVKSDSVQIIVTSYSDIISDSSFASSSEKLNAIINLLDEGKVRNKELSNNDGCTGGNGESIICLSKGAVVFSANIYHCGGSDSGDLSGDVSLAADAARALIPDIEGLMKR